MGKSNHGFTNLYIDMLIHNCHVKPENICLLTLDDEENKTLPDEHQILIRYYERCSLQDVSSAKTITFISLSKSNSFFIKQLLDYSTENADKIYIHLTEDELDRWTLTKRKFGQIVETSKNSVSAACLAVMPLIKNFIASEAAFRPMLENVLERNDFNIIDARDAFSVMPVKLLRKFKDLYDDNSQNTQPEQKILIGAKRGVFKLREVISLLRSIEKQGILLDYKYMIFTYKKRKLFRVLIDLYCLYLRHIKKKIIDISYPTVTNSVTYNALLMSCSHIVLQRRGGMTSIKEYIRMGRGVVHAKADSTNHKELTQSIGVDVATYNNFSEIASNIKTNQIDIQQNQRIITRRFNDSYQKLRSVYVN
ncbi:hypothetical protein [Vibrio quintilis]|uniref:hypothetical protein n=1 Tax=Vibrio quintilis TaxID=1117707 RepID=UPI0009FA60EB|nr:hypothetical protein [Vibrio quintilis]